MSLVVPWVQVCLMWPVLLRQWSLQALPSLWVFSAVSFRIDMDCQCRPSSWMSLNQYQPMTSTCNILSNAFSHWTHLSHTLESLCVSTNGQSSGESLPIVFTLACAVSLTILPVLNLLDLDWAVPLACGRYSVCSSSWDAAPIRRMSLLGLAQNSLCLHQMWVL